MDDTYLVNNKASGVDEFSSLPTSEVLINLTLNFCIQFISWPEKTADIWRRQHWFAREMTSEKRAQKFHTDDASLSRSE